MCPISGLARGYFLTGRIWIPSSIVQSRAVSLARPATLRGWPVGKPVQPHHIYFLQGSRKKKTCPACKKKVTGNHLHLCRAVAINPLTIVAPRWIYGCNPWPQNGSRRFTRSFVPIVYQHSTPVRKEAARG